MTEVPRLEHATEAGPTDRVATEAPRGVDPRVLAETYRRCVSDPSFDSAFSLLIARDGLLMDERYFRRRRGPRPTNLKSATKSILSLLVGIAIDEGAIESVDSDLAAVAPQFLADNDPRKGAITIRDLLTLRSGLEWDEWGHRYRDPRRMLRSANTVSFVLDKPLVDEPGFVFRYSTGTSQLLAAVLSIATATSPLEYARTRLFSPLGIDGVKWMATRDGVSCGGTHLFLTPRQMTAIGQLCLQGGSWMGQQLVSSAWIEESTRIHAGLDWWEGPYGYHWWIRPYGFTAYGYGGQFIYVVPTAALVLVLTASPNGRKHILVRDFERVVVEPLVTAIGHESRA